MPTPDEILAGLTVTTNRWFVFAVGWHLLAGVALIAASQKWRPSPQLGGLMLIFPLLSVSAFAWVSDNAFNGTVFSGLAAVLALISWRAPGAEVPRPRWATALGAILIAFAWIYPRFLQGWPQVTYLIAAPMGLIPGPTLALVMGLSLLGFGPSGRAWALTLASAGLFFAVFGALRLGVTMDLLLAIGAVGLTVRALSPQSRRVVRRLYLVKSEPSGPELPRVPKRPSASLSPPGRGSA